MVKLLTNKFQLNKRLCKAAKVNVLLLPLKVNFLFLLNKWGLASTDRSWPGSA